MATEPCRTAGLGAASAAWVWAAIRIYSDSAANNTWAKAIDTWSKTSEPAKPRL